MFASRKLIERSVGFVGLGAMGVPIALNMLDAGYRLRIWNRSNSKTKEFMDALPSSMKHLIHEASSLGDTLDGPDGVVVTMVSNDAALDLVSREILAKMDEGGIHVCLSTVSPQIAETLTLNYSSKGAYYISSPVVGRPPAAKAKRLVSIIGGNSDAVNFISPLIQATSHKVVNSGEKPSNSNILKLCCNYTILSLIETQAEAFTLAEGFGISRDVAFDLLSSSTGIFANPIITGYGAAVAKNDYSNVGFTAENGLKDASLIVEASKKYGVHMPIAEIVKERIKIINEAPGGGKRDWASFAELVKVDRK